MFVPACVARATAAFLRLPGRYAPIGKWQISPIVCEAIIVPLTEGTVILHSAALDGLVVLLGLRVVNDTRNHLHLFCGRCTLVAEVASECHIFFDKGDHQQRTVLQKVRVLHDRSGGLIDVLLRPGARVPGKPVQLSGVKLDAVNTDVLALFPHCDMELRKYIIRRYES